MASGPDIERRDPAGPPLAVVVLAWNGREDTLKCLASLEQARDEGTRVILVDNGSADGTAEAARERFPRVEVLRNASNLGFAGGNNAGLRHALDRGAELIVLLNNDTVVDAGFVRELRAAAARAPDAGFYSAKIYFLDRPNVLWFAGARFDARTGRNVHLGYGEEDRGQYDGSEAIDRPCGCAMMVTRRLVEEVGPMADELFLYGEEIDWMLRARKRGFRAVFVPRARVWHAVSAATGGEESGRYLYYCVRNMLRTLNAHAPLPSRAAAWARNVAVVAGFAGFVLRSRISKGSGLRNVFEGARDYARGITGPCPRA